MPDPPRIEIRRAYDSGASAKNALRILVDRLWPRGVSKGALKLDLWAKELAPSDALRRWFGHDPKRWREFESRYRFELAEKTPALKQIAELARDRDVVLLYGARDEKHNQAVVLRDVLLEGMRN